MATAGNGTRRVFRTVKFERLPAEDRELLIAAQQKLDAPYNPYSGFSVAASVRTSGGDVIAGTNIENAAYSTGICAERSTLSTAHNLGFGDQCVAIAVVARSGGQPTTKVTAPCGECRQAIVEYAHRSGVREGFRVLMATTNLDKVVIATIGDLLPLAFTPDDLLEVPVPEEG